MDKIYLKWKWAADGGHFEFYNKEKGVDEKIALDKMSVEQVSYTIKGWDDVSESAIYSNNITSFTDEELNIRSKSGVLASGLYKDVKEDVLAKWGKLHIQVDWKTLDWQQIVIQLKGLNFFQLSETLKGLNKDTDLLVFEWAEDDKKGAVKFKKTKFGVAKGERKEEEISVEDIPFS